MDVKVERGLNELGAAEIVAKIAASEITCEAVTRDCIERIAAREPVVKAWVNFNPELALAQAHALDREPRRGSLHGVPIGVKDVIDTFDMPTEMGSPIYRGYRPTADAACVALLRRAGAVILGKTNCDEFAMGSSNENSAYGPVRNPVAMDRVPGGSSGGSAAAVAAGLAVAALGTDTGGSIRQPGACCGVPAMMPTYGRVSRYGLIAFASSLDRIGPL
ncbi:MAG: amidase, partial [Xanthobacteraceae bacterium]